MRKAGPIVPPSPPDSTEPAPVAGSITPVGTTGTLTRQGEGVALSLDMSLREAMGVILVSGNYSPARLYKGRETFIGYSVVNPASGLRQRVKEKVRKKANTQEGRKWIQDRIRELNTMLALGWNPLRDGDTRKGGKMLREACDDFLNAKRRDGRRKDTMRSYESNTRILLRWVETCPTPQLTSGAFTEQHAKAFMNEGYISRGLRPKSFNNIHTFYITLWNWLKEQDYVTKNVFAAVKKKEIDPESATKRPPTAQERLLIREDLQRTNPRYFTFCLLCFHCGIRPKEAYMLKPANFDLAGGSILIPGTIAKNKRTMGIAIPNVLLPYLEKLGLDDQRPDWYVFSTRCLPGPVLKNSRDSAKLWDAMRKRTGLSSEVTMYQLKHAGGEQLSRDGLSDVDLMNHYRHHDLSETSTYTKRTYKEGVRTVVDKASAF